MKASLLATVALATGAPAIAAGVPVAGAGSVTGFSLTDLDRRALDDTAGIWAFVPNATAPLAPGLGSASDISMRGLGGGEALTGRDAAIGTVVDGVPLPAANGNRFHFFDLDRVSVLRGPQGGTGGAAYIGGAVDVQLATPSRTLSGYLESGYGQYRTWPFRASLDMPVSEAFALKMSGYRYDGRGYVDNLSGGDYLNDSDDSGMRLAAELRPSASFSWNVAIANIRAHGENLWNADCDGRPGCDGRYATTGMPTGIPNGGGAPWAGLVSGSKSWQALENKADTLLVTSNMAWTGSHHRLDIITGYARLEENYGLDFSDGRPLPTRADPYPAETGWTTGGAVLLADNRRQQVTQEARLSGDVGFVGYTVGGFYMNGQSDRDGAGLATVSPGVTIAGYDRLLRVDDETKAAYGEVSAALGPLKIAGGVRYNDESRTLRAVDRVPLCDAACFDAGGLAAAGIPTRVSEGIWTPHASVEWQASNDLLIYGSARRGYRFGGWNLLASDVVGLSPMAVEKGWSYEAGARGRWMDDRLRAGITGFVTRIDDAQASWGHADADGLLRVDSGNVGRFRNEGVEAEVAASPINGLNLSATLGWQNARYDANGAMLAAQAACRAEIAAGVSATPSCGRGIVTADGDIADPMLSPDWTASIGGSWDIYWKSGESYVTPSVYATWRSSTALDTANLVETGSRWQVNARIALATDDNFWSVALECANCLNDGSPVNGFAGLAYPAAPRTWMFKARRRF